MRTLLQVTAYPLLLLGTIASAYLAIQRGYDPGKVLLIENVLAAFYVALVERLIPYRREWLHSRGDLRVDILHLFASNGAFGLGRALLELTKPFAIWPTHWPLLAQFPLALLLAELGGYAFHRLEHRENWFWRLHSVHHSAPRLYWLNANRNHPLDSFITALFSLALVVLAGAGPDAIALTLSAIGAHALFQHADADVRLGPFNYLLSMCEVHRWHHSRKLEEANGNYGQMLLVWDVVFGTRIFPPGEPPVDTGLHALPWFPITSWFGQILAP